MKRVVWGALLLAACSQVEAEPEPNVDSGIVLDGGTIDLGVSGVDSGPAPDAGFDPDAAPSDLGSCPLGTDCNPIVIDTFPYSDQRTTVAAPSDGFDSYACAPTTDESGPEVIYRLVIAERSQVSIAVDDEPGDGVDVDVQLLSGLDPSSCTERDNVSIAVVLDPGTYYLVVDTWVSATGELAGPYTLTVTATPIATGACVIDPLDLEMFWTSCAAGIDCFEAVDPSDGLNHRYLRTPASGPVVLEAHLVTTGEAFPSTWPTSFTDEIQRHYQISQMATGYVMTRDQPWAPAGEGGSEYGQGSTGQKLPVIEEAFYINMYWRHRPAAGTRMLVRNTTNGRAVVAAAGFETGPGSNTAIAGVSEEVHDHLGTGHRDTLEVGFLMDQTLPFGPIVCP